MVSFVVIPCWALNILPLVVPPEIQARPRELNVVPGNPVAEQPARRCVLLERNGEAPCKIAQSGDHNQRRLVLPFPPPYPAALVVRDEPPGVGPDAVLV